MVEYFDQKSITIDRPIDGQFWDSRSTEAENVRNNGLENSDEVFKRS